MVLGPFILDNPVQGSCLGKNKILFVGFVPKDRTNIVRGKGFDGSLKAGRQGIQHAGQAPKYFRQNQKISLGLPFGSCLLPIMKGMFNNCSTAAAKTACRAGL